MEIKLSNGSITGKELFRLAWQGSFIGTCVIFLPVVIIVALTSMFSNVNEESTNALRALVIVPLAAFFQGPFIGGIILLGIKLWPPKKQ